MRALDFAADVGEQARASRGESGLGAHRPVQSRSARQVRASIPAACLHKDHWGDRLLRRFVDAVRAGRF